MMPHSRRRAALPVDALQSPAPQALSIQWRQEWEQGQGSPWACGLVSPWPLGTKVGSIRMCPEVSLLWVPPLTLVNSLSASYWSCFFLPGPGPGSHYTPHQSHLQDVAPPIISCKNLRNIVTPRSKCASLCKLLPGPSFQGLHRDPTHSSHWLLNISVLHTP